MSRFVIPYIAAIAILVASTAVAKETITVGITPTGVPFTFVDAATQKPTGAMVDLATAIAVDIGADVKFQINAFPALIPALTTGKINLISASMFVTAKRQEIIDFSTPVYTYGEAMFVAAGDSTNYTIEQLKGGMSARRSARPMPTHCRRQACSARSSFMTLIADMMRDVVLGRIKAGFGDRPIVAYQISKNPKLGVRLVGGYRPLHEGEVALAVAKNNSRLLDQVNASIAKFEKNGELAKILSRYGL